MKSWLVEVHGHAREVYAVDAETEEEALERWADGEHTLTEVTSAVAVSATVNE